MFAALLTVALLPDPNSLDALQGTWLAPSGVRLVIDGDGVTLISSDGWGFAGKLTITGTRLRIVDSTGASERTYRLDGRRLRVGSVDCRRVLPAVGERP